LGHGINLYADFNNVVGNTIKPPGIWYGIAIYGYNHTIVGNDVSGGNRAIAIGGTEGTNITGNYAHNSGSGIVFSHSTLSSPNNYVVGNIVKDNSYGIYFGELPSSGNLIYNNYLSNSINARDHGTNNWNTSKIIGDSIAGGPYLGGNYYSDYAGTDADGDGIGDTSYSISGGSNIDQMPLVHIPDIVQTFFASSGGVLHPVQVYGPNTTISGFDFNETQGYLSLTVLAGATRFINFTIPLELMEGALTALIDNKPVAAITTWNLTEMPSGPPTGTTSIYVTVEKGISNITIVAQYIARLPGDINNDGKVDIKDVAFVAKHFGDVKP